MSEGRMFGFEPFPKIGRLTRECVITEKIDGTNAQVHIIDLSGPEPGAEFAFNATGCIASNGTLRMFAGSRTRYVTPDNDNHGFASWVKANADDLFNLGPGRHFGEWWGGKIQRGYGLVEKRFSLFNTSRWHDLHSGPQMSDAAATAEAVKENAPACCYVVPELYRGLFKESVVMGMLEMLRTRGSQAVPFMNPEGIVIYHTAAGTMFKKLLENDELPKGQTTRQERQTAEERKAA